jgi:hypothetical protein
MVVVTGRMTRANSASWIIHDIVVSTEIPLGGCKALFVEPVASNGLSRSRITSTRAKTKGYSMYELAETVTMPSDI